MAAGAAAIEPTNTIFLAFLVYDVSHVLLEYPRLGSIDVVAHHVLFAAASYVCGANSVFFVALRVADYWGAVDAAAEFKVGAHPVRKGDTRLMTWTNRAFAFTFFVGRVVVYGLGLLHLFRSWEPHVESACERVPRPAGRLRALRRGLRPEPGLVPAHRARGEPPRAPRRP